jgi:polyisoprenoid-binding protein YceI
MSTTTQTLATLAAAAARLADGIWRLDPARSSVAFHVRHFYGLMTVEGEFADYEGALDLDATPALELTIQASTLDTKLAKRDEHLRSKDFFDVDRHPQVRFVSDSAALDGDLAARPWAASRRWPADPAGARCERARARRRAGDRGR